MQGLIFLLDLEFLSQLFVQFKGLGYKFGIVVDFSLDQVLLEISEEVNIGRQEGSEVFYGVDLVGSFSLVEVEEGSCILYLEVLGVELEFVIELFFEEVIEIVFMEFRFLGLEGLDGLEGLELFNFEGIGIFDLGVEENFFLEKLVFEFFINLFLEEVFNNWVGIFKVILFVEIVFLFLLFELELLFKVLRRQDKE